MENRNKTTTVVFFVEVTDVSNNNHATLKTQTTGKKVSLLTEANIN